MRLFTALHLEPEIVHNLQALIVQLKPVARLRWSPPENLHITTKFIGEWPPERLAELCERMPAQEQATPVSVRGIGFFPNQKHAKVFFAGVEPSPELLRLAQATDSALGELGVPLEKHPYRPHVTLARVPETERLIPLRDKLSEVETSNFGEFRATEFSLYESRAGRYLRLHTFSLLAAAR